MTRSRQFWDTARKLGRDGFIDKDFVQKLTTEAPQQYAQNYDKLKKEKKASFDWLEGGRADHAKDEEFSEEALAEGAAHEREHTKTPSIASEIAKDHLKEDPDYYKKLKKMEK